MKAVIFDFGGVLCLHPDEARIARTAEVCGMPLDGFMDAMWGPRLDYDAGLTEPDEYWRLVTGGSFTQAMIAAEVAMWNQYDSRVFAWIERLKAVGLKIGILSNLPRVLGQALRGTPGFLEPFDHITFSYELKSVKPQRAIYEHAFQGLGMAPGDALFLDDKLPNIEGAVATGLRAELFPSWEGFLSSGAIEYYALPAPPSFTADARRQ